MPVSKGIKVRINWTRWSHSVFLGFLLKIYKNLLGNKYFPNPPEKLSDLKAIIDRYSDSITAAMNGGRQEILDRNSLRETADATLRLLAHYVEFTSNDDPEIFATSGFEARPQSYKQHQPVETPKILKIDHGTNSGVLLFWLTPWYRKISHCELRCAVAADVIPETAWTAHTITSSSFPFAITELIPTTRYAFQVRALGKNGTFTDWSNSALFICT